MVGFYYLGLMIGTLCLIIAQEPYCVCIIDSTNVPKRQNNYLIIIMCIFASASPPFPFASNAQWTNK